ncbi:MAG: right-handed parallel beta-helix repeat-containing protein [Candidatus Thorarchaeota archaeon]|nr:right-handed parallel beta-helix repeat-containing protein [Candidatus Thorarchaeota archaeon]
MRYIIRFGGIVIVLLILLSAQNPTTVAIQNQIGLSCATLNTGDMSIVPLDALVESDPLVIDGNDDLASQGFPGAGTEEEPYIIEYLHINLNETPADSAIQIQNTTHHFEIHHCVFEGEIDTDSTEHEFYRGAGIFLDRVANARIHNNSFILTGIAVDIFGCENLTIESNYLPGVISEFASVGGILMGESGVMLGNGTVIYRNNRNVEVRNNRIENCAGGISCRWGENFDISGNVVVNGSGIKLHNINQSVIMRNVVEHGGWGVFLYNVRLSLVTENNLTHCSLAGIYMLDGFNCIIHQNICADNGEGLERGSEGGITLSGASHVNVTWNELTDNIRNALDTGEDNIFQYNYWSDYNGTDTNGDEIGDVPYEIPGTAENTDPFPRGPFTTSEPDLSLFILVGIGAIGVVVIVVVVSIIKKR